MGCGASAIQVAPAPRSYQNSTRHQVVVEEEEYEEVPLSSQISQKVKLVTQGISKVPKPSLTIPVLCLKPNSGPISVGQVCLQKGEKTDIHLPFMTFSLYTNGLAVVLGSIEILAQCVSSNTETSFFLENMIRSVSCVNRNLYKIGILAIPKKLSNQIVVNLQSFDFQVEVLEDVTEETIMRHHIIICTDQWNKPQLIRSFLDEGGGVIIGASRTLDSFQYSQDTPMNDLLWDLGVGFSHYKVLIFPLASKFVHLKQYSKNIKFTFFELAQHFTKLIEDYDHLQLLDIDNTITHLRYHIATLRCEENDEIKSLSDASWALLDNTNACGKGVNSTPPFVCPNIIQSLVFALISELLPKLPARYYEGVDRSYPFPGKSGEVELEDFEIHAEFSCGGWFSTGLYLPPGVVATVSIEEVIPIGLSVQIGCHTTSLVSQQGPWNRWGVIYQTYDIVNQKVEFSSPFGGIIYIVAEDFLADRSIEFDVTFTNVVQHPMYSISDPELINDITTDVPFGEIETQFVIFSLPTKTLNTIPNIEEFCDFFDSLLDDLFVFTNDESLRLFRVVFDIQIPDDGPICDYPIVFDYSYMKGIFFTNGDPSKEIFLLLSYIAQLSLPQDAFDDAFIVNYGILAAYYTFTKKWPDQKPEKFFPSPPTEAFQMYLKIYKENDISCFPDALVKVKESIEYMPMILKQNIMQMFTSKFNMVTKKNYTSELKMISQMPKPGEIMLATSSSNLSQFQIQDDDETLNQLPL
ncbi:hypothetical protein GPJ56_004694 [Histomonas meleagridis]|uniref:uncharacterized protein n=1 Tax=Histomonas meleagridis TaxID=135588 RepID=UPI00355A2053|nr:hypothetical protein GPJ56_004694 [Histomonas meleagridis]KAH0803615.1 hypothetical protein GO595_003580 [Histomonas meleagridis]